MLLTLAQDMLKIPIMLQLGIGGIFVIMVLREVANVLEKAKAKRNGPIVPVIPDGVLKQMNLNHATCITISHQVAELHEWHKPSPDGEQSWKNRQMIDLLTEFRVEVARGNKALENNNRLIDRLLPLMARVESGGR